MPLLKNRQADFSGPDFIPCVEYTVSYKDAFNLDYLYMLLYEWCIDQTFTKRGEDQDFPEVSYLQREHPQFGKEIWIRWRLERDSGSKFFKDYLDVDIHVVGLKDVELLIQGKKTKAHKGEIEFKVKSVLQLDPKKDWEKPFLKHFKTLWFRRIIGSKVGFHKAKLTNTTLDLQAAIKTYLKLPQFKPEAEARQFWAKKDT